MSIFSVTSSPPDTLARAGVLSTSRGKVETPVFMPVGTAGTVKGVLPRTLRDEVGARIILANTYHLYLRPGTEVIEEAGGLHRFMGWEAPILTDSGGYQVFSLAARREISEEGVTFRSHLDGSTHLFTPESVIDTQRSIGADIMMVLDECPAADADVDYARRSNDLTVRWAERCKQHFDPAEARYGREQILFAIVQGVVYPDVRRSSARSLMGMDFPGYAIGGLSVGEPAEQMYEMVEVSCGELPESKPRYLMGVGTPENLLECVDRGVDMFDCVLPSRNGRNGMIFTTEGIINIRNQKWRSDQSPVDCGLDAYVSNHFTRSYLRHLILSKELLGLKIATIQNLSFYTWLMRMARVAILGGSFASWKREVLPRIGRRL